MPYIPAHKRQVFDKHIATIEANWRLLFESDPGVGNYIITKLLHERVRHAKLSYAVLNEIVGILSSVKTEFERTVVAEYEDKKRIENGKI